MAEPLVKERRLTVSTLREDRPTAARYHPPPQPKPDRVVPYLRLRGRWLSELGFEAGVKVRVETSPGRLVLTPAADAGAGDA